MVLNNLNVKYMTWKEAIIKVSLLAMLDSGKKNAFFGKCFAFPKKVKRRELQ